MSAEILWAMGYGVLGTIFLLKSWNSYSNYRIHKELQKKDTDESRKARKEISRKRTGEEAEELSMLAMPDDDFDDFNDNVDCCGNVEKDVEKRGEPYKLYGKSYTLHRGDQQFHPNAYDDDDDDDEKVTATIIWHY